MSSEQTSQRPAYQQRVITERDELKERFDKLLAFMIEDNTIFKSLKDYEQYLLTKQSTAMAEYLSVLNTRIEFFDKVS